MGESYINSRQLPEEGERNDSHQVGSLVTREPTEAHTPLINCHSGDSSDLKIKTITSWCGAGDCLDSMIKREGQGLPWWCGGKESSCQCRGHGFEPCSGNIPHAAEQLSSCTTTTEPEL